jgi:hypothetical protein
MDSLQLDSTQLATFQQDPRYDYDRELVGGGQSLLEWLATVISEWLSKTFNVLMDNDVVYYTLVGVGVLLVGFLGWIVWKKNPKLFRRSDDGTPDYDVEEDTIYGIDFDAEIRQALGQHDYRQAVRLLYLQTLKQLSDAGRIDWQPSKTPMQYMRQMNDAAFRELSNGFIRVRYGNFEASEALFQRMKELQAAVGAGDGRDLQSRPARQKKGPVPAHQEKGGES